MVASCRQLALQLSMQFGDFTMTHDFARCLLRTESPALKDKLHFWDIPKRQINLDPKAKLLVTKS